MEKVGRFTWRPRVIKVDEWQSPDIDNLVSQLSSANLSEYRKIENAWARAIELQQQVSVNIEIKYIGNNLRPSEFIIEWTIEGKYFEKIIPNN